MKYISLILVALALACGDDDGSTAADAAADLATEDAAADGASAPDLRVQDAAPDADPVEVGPGDADPSDADPSDAGPSDAASDAVVTPDAGEPGDGAGFLQAIIATAAADCACFFEEEGYADVDQCAAVASPSSAELPCIEEAAAASAFAETVPCFSAAFEENAACVLAAGCDDETAADACSEAFLPALEACGGEEAFDAWFDLGQVSECTTGADVTCPTGDAGNTIAAAVFTGSSVGLGNQFADPGCHSEGPQATHVWTAPTAGTYVFDTVGSDFDTMLALYETCDADEELDCNDDGVADTLFSRVERELAEGESVVVVVEGFSGAAGNYVVNVSSAL
ncbi:MAG: hypothetical protein AAF411_07250 [Myxococcota bacterium]